MYKALFFGMPSVSISNTLNPIIEYLTKQNYEIVCFNTEAYNIPENTNLRFRAYPPYTHGYHAENIEMNISYFGFGELLIDMASSFIDFLVTEVEKEEPDLILHSHLAPWGKQVAAHFNLPAVSMLATFALHEKIMMPYLRSLNTASPGLSNIVQGRKLYDKIQSIYDRLELTGKVSVWDVYVNEEDLNLSFLPLEFQPRPELLPEKYHFLGSSRGIANGSVEHELIYVSLGTVFNKDLSFYKVCIAALATFKRRCIISTGKRINPVELGDVPEHIEIEAFSDQAKLLRSSAVFITQGGPVSVNEAIATLTPMVVIPAIPEQSLMAERIEELGIGVKIDRKILSAQILADSISHVLHNQSDFIANLKKMRLAANSESAAIRAHALIDSYLMTKKIVNV